jgi:hypothetical protein
MHQTDTINADAAADAFFNEMRDYHQQWSSHPSYEAAFYFAALAGLGQEPRHAIYFDYAEELIHDVINHHNIEKGSLQFDLIHECLRVAHAAARSGHFDDNPAFAAIVALEERGEVLAYIRGERRSKDLF